MFCENKDRARLTFIREFDKGVAGLSAVVMMAGSEKPVSFGTFPARIATLEAWSGTIASVAMNTLFAVSHLQLAEVAAGGRQEQLGVRHRHKRPGAGVDEAACVLPSSKQREAGDSVSQPRIRSSAVRSC